jgi:phosphatidate phosphatase PAH1
MFGIFAIIGVPLLVWGERVNSEVATIGVRVGRHDRDMIEQSRVQTIVNGQLTEMTKQLTRIDTQLEDILRTRKK